jgi:hypothetical protein
MFHVIEHVDDPSAIFERVARWLSDGGVFAIETPNIDCFAARIFKKTFWGGYHIPRHWNLFSAGTLTRLCEAAGLEVIKVKYQPGHSFWMYSLHHALRYGKRPRPRLATVLFDPFRGFLPFLVMFTVLDKVRAMVGARTGAMLMLARKPADTPGVVSADEDSQRPWIRPRIPRALSNTRRGTAQGARYGPV